MPTPQIPKVSSDASLEQLRDSIIGTNRYLTYLLSTLDTLNIKRLDAEVIIAQSITAGKLAADSVQTENLQAGAITTEKIDAGAVTAEKITVDELSAISADLGHITAGLIESIQIFGSYIATRNGSFPRAEMSNTGDLFAAYFNALNYIAVEADYVGVPSLNFIQGGNLKGRLDTLSSILEVVGLGGLILTASGGDIQMTTSGVIKVPSWDQLYNVATNRTLQEDLDNINSNIVALSSLYDSLNARVTALESP